MVSVERRTFLKLAGVPALGAALPVHYRDALDKALAGMLLPYRPDVPDVGRMFLPDPPHGWADTHAAWNGGVRPARALPYTLFADARRNGSAVTVELASGGGTGVFQLRLPEAPRTDTVQRGRRVSDDVDAGGSYDLAVHGPNGFFRGFTGGAPGSAELDVRATYDGISISLRLRNPGRSRIGLTVRDGYGSRPRTRSLGAAEAITERWSLTRSQGWYDLVVTVQGDEHFRRRYAGHVETGSDSITDPKMGGPA